LKPTARHACADPSSNHLSLIHEINTSQELEEYFCPAQSPIALSEAVAKQVLLPVRGLVVLMSWADTQITTEFATASDVSPMPYVPLTRDTLLGILERRRTASAREFAARARKQI
jgi:hypothetical protein